MPVRFIVAFAASALISSGAESTRVVVLQMPAAEAAAVRAELNDVQKNPEPETMDAVMKRRGLQVLAEFTEQNPWRNEPVELRKELGEIKFGGEVAQELAVKVKVEGGMTPGDGIHELLSPEIDLPAGAKSYRSLQSLGNAMTLRSGRWTERSCWGDGKQAWMVWQYPVVERQPEESPARDDGRWDSFHVELHWFQATDADLAKVAASKSETRDKAFGWLAGRAKLWQECGFHSRKGDRMAWSLCDLKLEMEGSEVVARQDGFSLDGEITGDGDSLQLSWNLVLFDNSDTTEQKLAATVVPGVWHFLPVQGVPGANVAACRVTGD
jgi:hypothetical protein